MQENILIRVSFECPMCGRTHYLDNIPVDKLKRIENRRLSGEYIQDILKEYSAKDREKFITGMCDNCQELLFGR